jgi:hypothetical protein
VKNKCVRSELENPTLLLNVIYLKKNLDFFAQKDIVRHKMCHSTPQKDF